LKTNTLQKLKPYLLLALVLFIAYLPLSSFYFGMKNDAFSDNFPDKYFISQSLNAGYLPLWNPYMNFGFPIYADPGFAFWNPITWLFATIGYSVYTLTLEVLFYIFLAGAFMLRLARWLKLSAPTAFAVACMYMCSGFFTGSIQYINFITAAAFLPLLLQSFLQLLQLPCLRNSALLSLAFYGVCMSGHPALPLASAYFLCAILLSVCIGYRADKSINPKKIILFLCVSAVLFLLLALPMLYSYGSIWKLYNRNATQQSFDIINTGLGISSLISFLFPFTTTAHSELFNNDVAMRNIYFSLLGLISLFFAFNSRKKLVYVFLITGFLMLVLSFGGTFKTGLYNYLPGLSFVRTNGEYRVFVILLFSLISGFGLENIIKNSSIFYLFKNIIKVFGIACFAVAVTLIIINKNELSNFFFSMEKDGLNVTAFKTFFESENLLIAFLLSICVSILICIPFFIPNENLKNELATIIVIDLIINTIIYLPVTGVGTTSLKSIQTIYNNNPAGIPIPPLIPVNKIDTLDAKTTGLVGSISYYNKKIGTEKITDYPSFFSSTDLFFKSLEKNDVLSKPYLFLKSGNKNFTVNKFSPQSISITVQSTADDSLIFLQNHYTFWKANNNGKEIPIKTAYSTFMQVPVNKGINKIEFRYSDDKLIYMLIISLFTLISLIIIICRYRNHTSTTSVLLK
jgi:hypothetical protein